MAQVDTLVHVTSPADKERLAARLAACSGVVASHVASDKPNLLFVGYDPDAFDIRSVPEIARDLGIHARLVEL